MALPTLKIVEKVLADKDELVKELANIIEASAASAIKERGLFIIGLSGGSMAKFVCSGLPGISTEWASWRLIFCDERLVPENSPDCTLSLYTHGILSHTPLKREQFIAVDTELPAEEAAKCYEKKLKSLFPEACPEWPVFDLLLLGVGPDGHTASLFPGHALLQEHGVWVAAITDSPKPPPCRVTLTYPVINSARRCLMALTGADKAPVVKSLREQRELDVTADSCVLPAARVRPTNGELVWLMDQEAAAQI